jgi:3-phenylpropionate/cinnamic acid dioxygenase small subunit
VSATPDRVADRLAINELLAEYSWALSDRDWPAWRSVFTDDAHVDYSTAGGPVCGIDEAAEWIEPTLAGFERTLSHGGNTVIAFDGDDRATVRSFYRMTMKLGGEQPTFIEASGWYDDVIVRTGAGWKISRRVEHLVYVR